MIAGGFHAHHDPRKQPWPGLHPVLSLGGLILGLAGCLVLPTLALAIILGLQVAVLHRTGLKWLQQLGSLRPWLPMLLFILAIHVFTTISAAPLGTPTWAGLQAGGRALLRLAATFGWLALFLRQSDQDDLVQAVGWWLGPLRRWGLAVEDFGLVLAVALGTAPQVMTEGRRIETSLRLRGSGSRPARGPVKNSRWENWRRRLLDRARLAVPLVESLVRRGETLTLSLRSRRPGLAGEPSRPVSWLGLTGLLFWAAALVAAVMLRR